MAVILNSGEIVGIVIVVLILLAAGIFICFRCWKSIFEVADTAKRERQSFTRTFRQSIRRSFRRTANRAGEFARRASFRGRAGSVNRQRRRPPVRPTTTGGSDLHPYYLQKKEEEQPHADAPPAYSEAVATALPENATTPPVKTYNTQTLDVTNLPSTNISNVRDRDMQPHSPYGHNQGYPTSPTSPYRPVQQYPGSGAAPQTPTSPYQQQPTTPKTPGQVSQGYPSPYNYNSGAQSPSYTQPRSTPSQPYTPTTRYASLQYPTSQNEYSRLQHVQPGYDSRKPSAKDQDDDDAGFASRQSRPRMISAGAQQEQGPPSGGVRDQYGNVYGFDPKQSYSHRSPSHESNPPLKSPVAKDLTRYYTDKSPGGSREYAQDDFSKGGRGYNDTARGQYDNSGYVQEPSTPSAQSRAPPPPQRGYSVERTQAYKDQYYQNQNPYSQSTSPRSPSGYPDLHRGYSREPAQSPGGSAFYSRDQSTVYLQGGEGNYPQEDTFI